MATILITHDLGVIAGFCREVMVMYGGQVMEKAPVDPLFESPAHPYTRGLLSAIPRVDAVAGEELVTIPGTPPNMMSAPKGCPFAPRCPHAGDDCLARLAPLVEFAPGRWRACNRSLMELA
jgi:oligopeptide transport system ATP-binding protein